MKREDIDFQALMIAATVVLVAAAVTFLFALLVQL